jgi:uncharacterized membrane protein YkoI
MMTRVSISLLALAALLTALAVPFAAGSAAADPFRSNWANPHASQDDAREGVQSGRLVSLDKVLGRVRAQVPGRVLDAELTQGRAPIYRIKILSPSGGVVHVIADARTGDILRVQGR